MADSSTFAGLGDDVLDSVMGGACYLYLNGECVASGPIDPPFT